MLFTILNTRPFEFTYSFNELSRRRIQAPVTVIKASGDDYSFIENSERFSVAPPRVVTLQADHYQLLKESLITGLLNAIAGTQSILDIVA